MFGVFEDLKHLPISLTIVLRVSVAWICLSIIERSWPASPWKCLNLRLRSSITVVGFESALETSHSGFPSVASASRFPMLGQLKERYRGAAGWFTQ